MRSSEEMRERELLADPERCVYVRVHVRVCRRGGGIERERERERAKAPT